MCRDGHAIARHDGLVSLCARFLGWLPDTMITFANSITLRPKYGITFTKT